VAESVEFIKRHGSAGRDVLFRASSGTVKQPWPYVRFMLGVVYQCGATATCSMIAIGTEQKLDEAVVKIP
jgi:hypothetical protein